ncbi:hypothetical protein H6G17_09305 [Chroococcidiopsis sp. FACHB-1243]|nr:hypothetical protein [Chroococcidiopsis sp. [FACHB-1243]]MBD2305707.1 hypothetical protein [Chroococcidiopsis sp. [FACHB-1243]]
MFSPSDLKDEWGTERHGRQGGQGRQGGKIHSISKIPRLPTPDSRLPN